MLPSVLGLQVWQVPWVGQRHRCPIEDGRGMLVSWGSQRNDGKHSKCYKIYTRLLSCLFAGEVLDSFGFFLIGFHSLDSEDFHYDLSLFTSHTHEMYLHILVQRYQTSQVSRQVPVTPSQQPCSSFISISSNSPCNSPTPCLIQDVTKARTVQNGCFREMNGNVCAKETYIYIYG